MQILIKTGSPESQKVACVVVGVYEKNQLSSAAAALDKASDGYLSKVLKQGDLDGKPGSSLLLHQVPNTQCARVLLLGCGKANELTPANYRKIHQLLMAALKDGGSKDIVSFLPELEVKTYDLHWKIRAAAETSLAALYRFDQLKSVQPASKAPGKLTLIVKDKADIKTAEHAIKIATAMEAGMCMTRDLANLPGNICTPSYLAEQAKALSKSYRNIKTKILDVADMEKLGMGSFLSVASGSHEPAKLICVEYSGTDKKQKPVALVGKGVTFDSGGISLKPGANMDEMKYDMGGAASVLGTLKACAELQLAINLVVIIPATENMPGGKAVRPGDVVTSLSGQTIEILNTDAEGRLILADALSYAEKYNPEIVIDVATLTGACIIALGDQASGLMSNDDALVSDLLLAGEQSGDRAWRLPLWEEYGEQLKSNFADMANIGNRTAGAIVAACFLAKFTSKYPWAHLDIAGTAWLSGAKKGATARPVPLLLQYLLNKTAAS